MPEYASLCCSSANRHGLSVVRWWWVVDLAVHQTDVNPATSGLALRRSHCASNVCILCMLEVLPSRVRVKVDHSWVVGRTTGPNGRKEKGLR